jgi:hypothetical protein
MESSMTTYQLAEHVHACRVENHCILLDLRRDKYIGIDGAQFDSVMQPRTPTNTDRAKSCEPLATELLAQGLIAPATAEATTGLKRIECANEELFREDAIRFARRDVMRLPQFLYASWCANRWLREWQLFATVAHVKARKQKGQAIGRRAPAGLTADLVRSFQVLRPIFPRRYLCLFDSLALVNFLAGYGIHPDWIFAVREDPFTAHCWVQQGGVVLNDEVEHISLYTPIMDV